MKRKLSMIVALSAALTILAACKNTNENNQVKLDNDLIITESASAVAEAEVKQEIPASAETYKEITPDTSAENAETISTSPIEFADFEMPTPFVNGGGDNNAEFYSTVNLKLGYIDMSFVNLVGVDEFESWLNSTSSSSSELTSVGEAANLYSFIKYFNISSDFVRENLVNMRNGSVDDFSDEEIDLITSDNDEAVATHFAADTAILKGSNLYSLYWVYYHTPSDYAANGITAEDLNAVLPLYDQFITEEARQAIENKITTYVNLEIE